MPTLPLTTPLVVQQSVARFDAARILTRAAQYDTLTRDQVALVLTRIQMTAAALPGVLALLSDELIYPSHGLHPTPAQSAHDAYLHYVHLASGHLARHCLAGYPCGIWPHGAHSQRLAHFRQL